MEYLIGCRHGAYGSDGNLTAAGREEAVKLASSLHERLSGQRFRLLTSPVTRAVQTANILTEHLHPHNVYDLPYLCPVEEVSSGEECYLSGGSWDPVYSWGKDMDGLIVVGHADGLQDLLVDMAGRKGLNVRVPELRTGQGLWVGSQCVLFPERKVIEPVRRYVSDSDAPF
ncbi:MAG: SixA phosphatase family protein [Nanoarchaeota archaeon]